MSPDPAPTAADEREVEILIIGAGVSGIDAACHLETSLPGTSYAVLERRQAIGGTWDLFRYPGVRSDSDMLTFGYGFRPWNDTKILADGASIREYVRETAEQYGVVDRIRFGRQVRRASWSSEEQRWSVEVHREDTGATETWRCRFLLACTGYYDYDAGYRPHFPGEEDFGGTIVHPQFWPEDLDHAGKRVVVIGSGATAVTLVPAMADTAEHVTMLQRSPTWIVSLPAVDKISLLARKVLPAKAVYRTSRARNILTQRAMYALARSRPGLMRKVILAGARKQVGEQNLHHFTPSYDPWTQRLCVIPDGDLFAAVRDGRADVVTDTIDSFTATGIRTSSGQELPADIIVTATGLQVKMLGGAEIVVDGEPVVLRDVLTYKGVLVEDIPNLAMVFGYTNASWTLKADLACDYVVRLIEHMRAHGWTQVVPRGHGAEHDSVSVLGSLESGYVRRGDAQMPRQGRTAPWRVMNNYLRDAVMLRLRPVDDGNLEFSAAPAAVRREESVA